MTDHYQDYCEKTLNQIAADHNISPDEYLNNTPNWKIVSDIINSIEWDEPKVIFKFLKWKVVKDE